MNQCELVFIESFMLAAYSGTFDVIDDRETPLIFRGHFSSSTQLPFFFRIDFVGAGLR